MSQFETNIAGILSQSLAQMEGILNRHPVDYTTACGESVKDRDCNVKALIKDGWYISGSAYSYIEYIKKPNHTDRVVLHCQPMVRYWEASK